MVGRFCGGLHARRGRIVPEVVVKEVVCACRSIVGYESAIWVEGVHGRGGGDAIDIGGIIDMISVPFFSSTLVLATSISSAVSALIKTSDIDILLTILLIGVTIGDGGFPHTGLTFPPIPLPRPQANDADNGRRTREEVALQPMNIQGNDTMKLDRGQPFYE